MPASTLCGHPLEPEHQHILAARYEPLCVSGPVSPPLLVELTANPPPPTPQSQQRRRTSVTVRQRWKALSKAIDAAVDASANDARAARLKLQRQKAVAERTQAEKERGALLAKRKRVMAEVAETRAQLAELVQGVDAELKSVLAAASRRQQRGGAGGSGGASDGKDGLDDEEQRTITELGQQRDSGYAKLAQLDERINSEVGEGCQQPCLSLHWFGPYPFLAYLPPFAPLAPSSRRPSSQPVKRRSYESSVTVLRH